MPDKFWSLQRQIETYLENPKMMGKSPKTKKSTRQALMHGARKLKEAGRELNPNKMGQGDMIFPRDHGYGGPQYHRCWSMTSWKGFLKLYGNRVFETLVIEVPKCARSSVRWLKEGESLAPWQFILAEANPIQRTVLTLECGLGLIRIELERLKVGSISNGRITVIGKGRNGGKP